MDGFSGEARIKKPTAKTPPRQGEGEIPGLEIDVDVHSQRTFFVVFATIKKQNLIPLRGFHSFTWC